MHFSVLSLQISSFVLLLSLVSDVQLDDQEQEHVAIRRSRTFDPLDNVDVHHPLHDHGRLATIHPVRSHPQPWGG